MLKNLFTLDIYKKMKTKLSTTHQSLITNHQSLSSRGFTLIELLVVIGVLGIMATALVATIDPVEQIRKAQDSNVKNASIEYINAMVRYYATHQYYPWDLKNTIRPNCNTNATVTKLNAGIQVYTSTDAGMNECTGSLIDEKELKGGFITDINNITSKVYLSQQSVPSGDVTVCFLPTSKSQKVDSNTKYAQNGNPHSGACTIDSTDCYWCAK